MPAIDGSLFPRWVTVNQWISLAIKAWERGCRRKGMKKMQCFTETPSAGKFSQDLRNPTTETIEECLWKGKLIVIEEI